MSPRYDKSNHDSSDEFRVSPVRRYRVPKYPSWEDPNPLDAPSAPPFPYRKEFLAAIAATTLGASTLGAQALSGGAKAIAKNPFTVRVGGLPYRSSPYGTGQPQYMSESLARATIERVFREAGIRLESKHRIEVPLGKTRTGEFLADGYDPKKKVGYVYAKWDRCDESLMSGWMGSEFQEKVRRARRAARPGIQKKFDEARAIEDEAERTRALTALIEEVDRDRLSRDEARAFDATKGPQFIAVISGRDRRFQVSPTREDYDRINKAMQIEDEGEKRKVLREIQEKIAAKAIANLEKGVRDYLRWAQSQGLGS